MSQDDEYKGTNVVPLVQPEPEPLFQVTHTEAEDAADAEEDAFLQSLLGMPVPAPELTSEQIQAQSDFMEASLAFDVDEEFGKMVTKQAEVRAIVKKHLQEVSDFLNGEWNKAVVTDNKEDQKFLVATEAPRWFQMASTDFQVAFMKLDRCIDKMDGM